jgi:Flp pilus assembly pilin Flp
MRGFGPFRRAAARLLRGECGATAVEYAVLLALVVLACAAGVLAIRGPMGSQFDASTGTLGAHPYPGN